MDESILSFEAAIVDCDGDEMPRMVGVVFDVEDPAAFKEMQEVCDDDPELFMLRSLGLATFEEAVEAVVNAIEELDDDELSVRRVHLGGNWVVLTWSDGTVTKLQPHPDDEYNPLAGVLAMTYRKLGRNHVRYSRYDPVTEAIAGGGYSANDLRFMASVMFTAADVMELKDYDPDYRPGCDE